MNFFILENEGSNLLGLVVFFHCRYTLNISVVLCIFEHKFWRWLWWGYSPSLVATRQDWILQHTGTKNAEKATGGSCLSYLPSLTYKSHRYSLSKTCIGSFSFFFWKGAGGSHASIKRSSPRQEYPAII